MSTLHAIIRAEFAARPADVEHVTCATPVAIPDELHEWEVETVRTIEPFGHPSRRIGDRK